MRCLKNLAVNENFNFNIRGGSSRVDYFMSATVRHEEGMLKNLSRDYFSYNNNYSVWRYAFQNNVNVNLTKSTKVSLKINTQLRDTHGPVKSSENIFGMIMNGNPADMPITFPDDPTVNHIRWGGKAMVKNPVAEMVTGYRDEFQSVLNANLSLDQNFDFITEGLSASALISFKTIPIPRHRVRQVIIPTKFRVRIRAMTDWKTMIWRSAATSKVRHSPPPAVLTETARYISRE